MFVSLKLYLLITLCTKSIESIGCEKTKSKHILYALDSKN